MLRINGGTSQFGGGRALEMRQELMTRGGSIPSSSAKLKGWKLGRKMYSKL